MHSRNASTSLLLAAIVVAGCSPGTQAPATSETRQWLDKADEAVRQLASASSGQPQAQGVQDEIMVVATCVDVGELDKARQIAARLSGDWRGYCVAMIAAAVASSGNDEAAISEAEGINPPVWYWIAVLCAKKSPASALKFAAKVEEPARSYVYAVIAQQQVLAGDLAGAEATVAKIIDKDERQPADLCLAAGKLANVTGDLRKAVAASKVQPDEMWRQLRKVGVAKATAGDIESAARILDALDDNEDRAAVNIAIATYHQTQGNKAACRKAIDAALADTLGIRESVTSEFVRAVYYTKIASLQVRAGDLEAGIRTVRMAQASGNAEAEPGKGLGAFKALGGNVAIIGLFIEAGKMDEAEKSATKEDGTLMPEILALLVERHAAQGNSVQAARLVDSARSPNDRYKLCLAAARGTAQHLKAAGAR